MLTQGVPSADGDALDIGRGGAGLLGVEIGQRYHGENLAGMRVHDEAATAHRMELFDLRRDLAVEHML